MPPWADIDTIMFDMDGTLLDLHFDNYFWQQLVPKLYGEKHGVSENAALEIIYCKYAEVRGTLTWYCLDYWEQELQLEISELKTTLRHKINVRPNVERILQELKLSEKRVLLITNAHPSSLKIKMEHTGISHYFDQCISSHTLKLAKENHGFWASLQSLEQYDPDRTVLFDDSLPVLRQARREGIRHLFGIEKPDSKRPAVLLDEFPQIEDFGKILPSLPGIEIAR
ncbi:MAG: GMP/IMP nucleotidase [Pseudohongiellaceae bacterium]